MFRAVHRSSSGALNCICSLWFIYPCGDRPLPRLRHFPLSLGNGRSPRPVKPVVATAVVELLVMGVRSVGIAVLLVVAGPAGPTTTNSTAITTLRR